MAHYYNRRTGQVVQVGADYPQYRRSYVGGDRTALLGEDAILGQDGGMGNGVEGAVAQARAAGGYVAQTKSPVPVAFFQLLPFSVTIDGTDGAGPNTVNIQLQPQRTFRVDNLVITSPEGPFFELESWNVGQENMFVAEGSVNCAAFSEAAAQRGLGLRGFTANQGALINIRVTNLDADSHRLSGFFSGPAVIAVG